jgi:hypothetical protein
MKFIRQNGKAVYRELPHTDKTLANAADWLGVSESELQVVDEAITPEEYGNQSMNDRPWLEKIIESDKKMIPRYLEDLITSNSSLVIPAEMKKRYDDKVALRATKP